ncbi:MAG: hypothetical protein MJ227_01590 [Bacilli bacterium]|nr:hypothetical protein [Bacilli bacterium]
MIKIFKIENMYGIKKLLSPELIKGNTIIYAPNGVMKTSFADGMNDIICGKVPYDAFCFPKISSTFKIENNGKLISNSSTSFTIDAFVFKPSDYSRDVFSDPKIGSLVMSNSLKIKYKNTIEEYKKDLDKINELISKIVFGKKKIDIVDIDVLIDALGGDNFENTILSIPDLSVYNDDYYKTIEYYEIFNEKTFAVIESPDFVKKCNAYNKYINVELDKTVFNNGFDFNGLLKVQKELISSNYFDAGNKVHLNSQTEMDKKGLQEYVDKVIRDVYVSPEARLLFEDAQKVLNKNKDTKKLAKILCDDNRCLKELSNQADFKKKIIYTKLRNFSDEIELLKKKIEVYQKDIKSLIDEAEKTKETWKKILDEYNNRFISNKFNVVIENIKDAILDINPPVFKKVIKGTNKEITEEVFKRFSSGERRAVMILNLLFEIELRKGQKFALILDDISDSFDYKNKYAIIECLKDIAKNTNIQLIILTHNFDFYRSVRLSLGNDLNSKLFAYTSGNDVALFDAKTKNYENFSFYTSWKGNGNEKEVIATIPFLRNLVQLQSGNDDDDYTILTKFLHYNENLESANISELYDVLDRNHVVHSFDDFNYLQKLKEITYGIITDDNINETDLLEKVILGIFIRIYSDKIMFKKNTEIFGTKPEMDNVYNPSRVLYEKIKNSLDENLLKVIQTALIVSPSFIHVNSFMFEPLIDVGTERLKETASEIMNLLI